MKYIRNGLFLFGVLFVLLWQSFELRKVSLNYLDGNRTEHTLILSHKDRKRLLGLMEKLFAEDNFAYTLLGSKPVSWACYYAPLPFLDWSNFSDSLKTYSRTIRLGWKTWEKYHHLFPSNTFFLESPQCYPGSRSILLINTEKFNLVIRENIKDFEKVLKRRIEDGFQLLREAKHCSLMGDVLKGHQALLGIVLGYGTENSWQFLEKSKKREPLGWVWNEAEYWNKQENTRQCSASIEYNLSLYSCPSFAGIPTSEESQALKNEYIVTKHKVLEYYKGKDFLEATLNLLAGFRPDE